MSKDEDESEQFKLVVQGILAAGKPLSSVIYLFATALHKLGSHEEAELIRDVASVTRESEPESES